MKKQVVVIFGSNGLLGREFVFAFKKIKNLKIFALERKDLDISNPNDVFLVLKKIRPNIVINCAANINIEDCERNPNNAWLSNAIGPGNLARSLKKVNKNAIFLHFSTCDVFGCGRPPFNEDALESPLNIYAFSKLGGEKLIKDELAKTSLKYYIARVGLLYGINKKTLVDNIAASLINGKKIEIVSDQYTIPSWTKDVVQKTLNLVFSKNKKSGIYHIVNCYEKIPSRYDIAVFIAETLSKKKSLIIKRRLVDLFSTPKPRRAILFSRKIKPMRDWRNSLEEYLIIKGYEK